MARKDTDRVGDILGLGDTSSSSGGHHDADVRAHDADAARRHRRMSEGADEVTPTAGGTTPERSSGATSIDMGDGGEGTDLE